MRASTLLLLLASILSAADVPQAGNVQVEQVMKSFKGRGVMADDTPASKSAEALTKFTTRPDLVIDLMAAEPLVAQPIYGLGFPGSLLGDPISSISLSRRTKGCQL